MYTVNPPWIDSPQTLRQQVEGRRHGSHLLDRLKREPCELSSTPYSSSSPWCYEVCLVDLQTSGLEFLKYLIGFWCFRYIYFFLCFFLSILLHLISVLKGISKISKIWMTFIRVSLWCYRNIYIDFKEIFSWRGYRHLCSFQSSDHKNSKTAKLHAQ